MTDLLQVALDNAKKRYEGKRVEFGWTGSKLSRYIAILVEGEKVFSASGTKEEIQSQFINEFIKQ